MRPSLSLLSKHHPSLPLAFKQARRAAAVTPRARDTIRAVFAARPGIAGLTTQDILHILQESPPVLPAPHTHNTHAAARAEQDAADDDAAIRSMRYLKRFVLATMEIEGLVKKVHVKVRGETTDAQGQLCHIVSIQNGEDCVVPALSLTSSQPSRKPQSRKSTWVWRWLSDEERRLWNTPKKLPYKFMIMAKAGLNPHMKPERLAEGLAKVYRN